jgi:hypothetical protein
VIVHVAVVRSFEPLDLDVDVFADVKDAEAWCEAQANDGAEDENLFVFTAEVR